MAKTKKKGGQNTFNPSATRTAPTVEPTVEPTETPIIPPEVDPSLRGASQGASRAENRLEQKRRSLLSGATIASSNRGAAKAEALRQARARGISQGVSREALADEAQDSITPIKPSTVGSANLSIGGGPVQGGPPAPPEKLEVEDTKLGFDANRGSGDSLMSMTKDFMTDVARGRDKQTQGIMNRFAEEGAASEVAARGAAGQRGQLQDLSQSSQNLSARMTDRDLAGAQQQGIADIAEYAGRRADTAIGNL